MAEDTNPNIRRVSEWVGPKEAREEVSGYTDRALIIRALDEVLCLRFDLGKIVGEQGRAASRLLRLERRVHRQGNTLEEAEEEITLVRDLRKLVKRSKRRFWLAVVGLVATIATSYILMRLGVRIPIP